ncbi:Uncharacterised protein [Mycobacteroides abscessus subsp. abscessus]|nr:Uncharacterised protein [Mycobacteroides abscessus subsp. abscessus]
MRDVGAGGGGEVGVVMAPVGSSDFVSSLMGPRLGRFQPACHNVRDAPRELTRKLGLAQAGGLEQQVDLIGGLSTLCLGEVITGPDENFLQSGRNAVELIGADYFFDLTGCSAERIALERVNDRLPIG